MADRIVHFNFYCPCCEFADTAEAEYPCCDCLNYGGNDDSHCPVCWKPGDMSKWPWDEIQFNTDAMPPAQFFEKLRQQRLEKKQKGG